MFPNELSFIRLWRNECTRVFSDKLIVQEDRDLVCKASIPDLIGQNFSAL